MAPFPKLTASAERLAAGALVGAFVAAYLWIAWSRGALGAARNDDWSYLRVAIDYWRTGRITLDGFVQMSFIGQAVLGRGLFTIGGPSIVAAQFGVAVIGGVGVLATFVLLRSFLAFGWSLVACAVLLCGPVFGTLSVSFMTDVPSYAAQMLALLLGWRAVAGGRVSLRWLLAATAAGLYATSIREFGVVACAVVLGVAMTKAVRGRDRPRVIGVAVVGSIATAIVIAGLVWRHLLPHDLTRHAALHPRVALTLAAAGALSLALFLSPCALALSPRRTLLAAWHLSRAGLVLALGLSFGTVGVAHAQFLGNYFTILGSYPGTTAGALIDIVPVPVFLVAQIVAAYALTMLAVLTLIALLRGRAAAGRDHSPVPSAVPLVTAFVVALAAVHLSTAVASIASLNDRYTLPLIPLLGGLALAVANREDLLTRGWSPAACGAGLVVLALVGALIVDASAAVDGAKWTLAARAEALGYPPESVDGGFEWFGFHQIASVEATSVEPARPWWTGWFPRHPICATVSISQSGEASLAAPTLAASTVTTLFGQRLVLVLRPGPDACATRAVR